MWNDGAADHIGKSFHTAITEMYYGGYQSVRVAYPRLLCHTIYLYHYGSIMRVLPEISMSDNCLPNEVYFSYCIPFCRPLFFNCYHHYHHHHHHPNHHHHHHTHHTHHHHHLHHHCYFHRAVYFQITPP